MLKVFKIVVQINANKIANNVEKSEHINKNYIQIYK